MTAVPVREWRAQFEAEGLTQWGKVRQGRGRKATISDAKIAEIVDLTLHHLPEGHTHWSCRPMAEHVGVSPATVQRIWDAPGLKPPGWRPSSCPTIRRSRTGLQDPESG